MKEFTKEKAVELHRAMWGYIVERIDCLSKCDIEPSYFLNIKMNALDNILCREDLFKGTSPEEYGFLNSNGEVTVKACCFLCEYSERQSVPCEEVCPLYNPKGDNTRCLNGLYYDLLSAYSERRFNSAKSLAIKIRDLPVVN